MEHEPIDVAIAGAGVLGLAHAYHAAKRGLKVAVYERNAKAVGASIRNFGMLWPIGQPTGELADLALRSVALWKELLADAGIWCDPCGSLHVAYEDDEAQVIAEFLRDPQSQGRGLRWLEAAEVTRRYSSVRPDGLKGGLFSPHEACVDPRQVVAELPAYLERKLGVRFHFGVSILGYNRPGLRTSRGIVEAKRLIVCNGADYKELYPAAFEGEGVMLCKLQMLRTPPMPGFKLGTHLAAGLTLRHYKAFANCPTLPALAKRFDDTMPEYHRWGIHVMASQNGLGELILGDSHEYGDHAEPFDKPFIDELILKYLKRFLNLDEIPIAGRWHGVYAKHPTKAYVARVSDDGVICVNAVGGAGMTLSFGLGEQIINSMLEESL